METTFFNQFTPEQLKQGYINSFTGLRKCYTRSLKTGKYNGRPTAFWSDKVKEYENILKTI